MFAITPFLKNACLIDALEKALVTIFTHPTKTSFIFLDISLTLLFEVPVGADCEACKTRLSRWLLLPTGF